MLFVDDEQAEPGQGVTVDSPECAVVDDAHAAGELSVELGEAADCDGGFVFVFPAGDVAEVHDDATPVAVVAAGGEEPFGSAHGLLSFFAVFVVDTGCGVDASEAHLAGIGVPGDAVFCSGGGFGDGRVADEELPALWVGPVPGGVGGEEALLEGLVNGVVPEELLEVVEVRCEEGAFGIEVLGACGRGGVMR